MRENLQDEQAIFRGGKNVREDERQCSESKFNTNRVQKSGLRTRKWLITFAILLLTTIFVINGYANGQFRIVRFSGFDNQENDGELFTSMLNSEYLVSNKGCQIPAMDPFDPAIKRYIQVEKPIVCKTGNAPALIESNNIAIYINKIALNYYYNDSAKAVNCCWTSFSRSKDQDNSITYDRTCHYFNKSAIINTDFIRVECWRGKDKVYKDYHAFVPEKLSVEERCQQAQKSYKNEDRISVLVIGIDSVSRLNFHRSMPKTLKALQELKAAEMLGYTKTADNTYPNLVTVLSGLHQNELKKLCWQNKKKTFDDCPFIWKKFSALGYRTAFGEDACHMSIFNYLKPGFRIQPTDYYLRPYCLESENNIGNTNRLNANLCVGTRLIFQNLIHYARKLAIQFSNKLYFGFMWMASLTHDYLNLAQLGDDVYYNFIRYLMEYGLLNNTALIMMSDHGMRFGDFRQTYQGKMEDSLPFAYVVLPNWWRNKFSVAWANMRRNTHSLTTGYDIYETLNDILHPQLLEEEILAKRSKLMWLKNLTRGISWFLPIPDHRTCAMANIPGNLCMCHRSIDIPVNTTIVHNCTTFLISELNKMLDIYPQCATLKLKTLKQAKVLDDVSDSSWLDYSIQFVTQPGNAVFEGTVRYRNDDKSFKLIGTIGRLNAYGTQSACMNEFNMRLYCYCL